MHSPHDESQGFAETVLYKMTNLVVVSEGFFAAHLDEKGRTNEFR